MEKSLTNRKQYIQYNINSNNNNDKNSINENINSNFKKTELVDIICRLPQGSILKK